MKHMRVTAFILVIMMVLSLVPFSTFALEEKTAEDLFASPEISVLSALGVIDLAEMNKKVNEPMTRGDFAKLAVRLRGWESLANASSEKLYFYDVTSTEENASYISIAASLCLMKAKRDGYFEPNSYVTKIDVVETILNVLGYDAYLKARESKGVNAMSLASKIGLLKGVSASNTLTVSDILAVVKNSVEIDVLYASTVGTVLEYTTEKGTNLLAAYHNVYKSQGIVTANSNTGLEYVREHTPTGKIRIANSLFKLSDVDYGDLLGHSVVYYYQEDGNNEDAKLIFAQNRGTTVLKLTTDEICDFDAMQYHYYDEDDRLQKADVKGAMVIYNDTAVEMANFNFVPQNGDVTLVDNNDDGDYEVILINDYIDSVVSATDISKNTVYFKTISSVDLSAEENARIINASNGVTLDVTGFRSGSVVSIARGTHGKITKMIVDFNYLNGQITKISNNSGLLVDIDGVQYKVSNTFASLVESNKAKELTIGSTGRFYLNYLGNIVTWEPSGSDGWEYVIFNGIAEKDGLSSGYIAQFYTISNQFEVFPLKKTLVIDGQTVSDKTTIYNAFCRDGEWGSIGDKPVKQVMRIKRNSKNEVTHIDRVGDEDSGGVYIYNGVKNRNLSWYRYGFCFGTYKDFGSLVDTKTAIITCPTDGNGALDTSDPKKMGYGSFIGLSHQTTYNVSIYKTDKNQIAADMCLIGENSTVDLSYSAMFYVLLGIVEAVNDEGEVQLKLVYSNADGEILEHFVDPDYVDIKAIPLHSGLSGTYELKIGDAFRRHLFGNEITYIQPIFDNVNKVIPNDAATNETNQLLGSYLMSSSAWVKYGYVKKIENDMVLCGYGNPDDGGEEFSFVINTTYATVLEYDRKRNTLKKGTIAQITDFASSGYDCTHFLINLREGHVTYQFIIYK